MSYAPEDRHERDVGGSSRNPGLDMEKHEKTKGPESGSFHRPLVDQGSHKIGKSLQNRPIAPASGSLAGMIPGGHLNPGLVAASGMPAFSGHHLIASMMRMPQPAFSHVPAGAAAGAALAGVTPRNTSLRTPSLPPSVKPMGLSAQMHSSGGQAQAHAPSTTSRPSSPGMSPHIATVAVASSMHQSGSDHKSSDLRDGRPAVMSDLVRRGASPTVQSVGPAHNPASGSSKVMNIVPATPLAQPHPVQKSTVPTLPQHHPGSVHTSIPATATGVSSIANSMPHMPSQVLGIPSGHSQQSKIMPVNSLSVAPAILTTTSKLYTPPHHLAFTAPRQAPVSSSETTMNPSDHARLTKASGSASPAAVSSHHPVSSMSSVPHIAVSSLNSAVSNESRMERAHQALTQYPYHAAMAGMPGMANLFYQDPLSAVHPGLHASYHQSAFGPMQPLSRSQQSVATSAAAAAAAQVAAAAAAGVNPMQIMEHPRLIFQPTAAALGVGGSGIANLSGTETPVTAGIMDISQASLYSVPLFNVPPAGIQAAQFSAPNPTATSPRPSILRKRTSEGIRKPPSQLPFTAEVLASSQPEAAASPRSDSTLSAPHSTQNSPKPASECGSQSNELAVSTAIVTTAEPAVVVSHTAPVSPVKIMREPCTEATPSSSAVITAVMNGSASVAAATHALTSITTANSDAASPRKKPRKQNVVATEDKYGSNVNMEPDSPVSEEKTVKAEEADEDLKFILMKRPRISIVANYKINTKAAHNHFQRYSDVKAKEERKPSIQEIASQKGVVQRANGWRVQHIAGQIDELITAEQEVLKKMGEFREKIPKVKPGQKTKFQDDLVMLNELLQGNIQRSQLVVEQLGDSRKSMVKVLEHRQRVMDIIQKQMNKRNPKKKSQ